MPEGFGHEYPLGGENVLKLQDALVCALDGVGTTRDIVSRNSATKNENGCPRNFITLLLEVLHLLNAPNDFCSGSTYDSTSGNFE
jgi:hypothetical protein